MNKKFYLFRHGLATKSKHGYGKKILSATVLPEGKYAINKLAFFLKNIPESLNFSSKIIRCQQTTDIISQITNKKFNFDPRLNEFYQETFTDFKKRVQNFLRDLNQLNNSEILICTHGIVIAAIKHFLLKGKFTKKDRYDYPKTGELVIIENTKITKMDFN